MLSSEPIEESVQRAPRDQPCQMRLIGQQDEDQEMAADLAMWRSLVTLRRAVSWSSGGEGLTHVGACGRAGKKWTNSSRQVLLTEPLSGARGGVPTHHRSQHHRPQPEKTGAQTGSGPVQGPTAELEFPT